MMTLSRRKGCSLSRRARAWSLAGATLLATAVMPAASYAQTQAADLSVDAAAEAKRQFLLGRQAFDGKRFADAAQNFEAAAAYKPHPVTFYTAAVAWELAGRSDRAADAYARALEQASGLKEEDSKKARERLTALEALLGTVRVTAPDGWRLQLDGNTDSPGPAQLHAKPGLRVLVYRAPGKAIEKKEVTLEAGKVLTITLPEPTTAATAPHPSDAAPPPPPKPEIRSEDTFTTIRRSAGLVIAGVGAAGLISSIIIWSQAQDAKDVYDGTPTKASYDHGTHLETWTNVTLIGGMVLLAGGVALYLVPGGGSANVSAGTGSNPAAAPAIAPATSKAPSGFAVGLRATANGAFLDGRF